MATSGFVSVAATAHDALRFSWWYGAADQSIPNNQTLLHWKMELIADSYGTIDAGGEFAGQSPWEIVVDGEIFQGAKNLTVTANQTKTLASGTKLITHNPDGSRSFAFSFSQQFYITFAGQYIEVVSGSGTGMLDAIARKAWVKSAPDFTDEEIPVVTYENPAGAGAEALQVCLALTGATDIIAAREADRTGTACPIALTDAEKQALYNATAQNSRQVVFLIRTALAGAVYDSSAVVKTFRVVNADPVILPTVTDTNEVTKALTGDPSALVKYYSNAAVTVGASPQKGAYLTASSVTNGGRMLTGDGSFAGVESPVFTFSATDSRGNTTTLPLETAPFVDYVRLTCAIAPGTPDVAGNFTFKVTGSCFNGTFGHAPNTLTVKYRYRESTGSYPEEWSDMTVVQSGSSYTATAALPQLHYKTAYVFQAYAQDALATVHTGEKAIQSTPVFDWSATDFRFHVPVTFAEGSPVRMVKLWENGSLKEEFPAQTLSLDLTGWDYVMVMAMASVGDMSNLFQSPFVPTVKGVGAWMTNFSVGAEAWAHARHFSIVPGGIAFGAGSQINVATGDLYSGWNGRAIPYRIFGIRGVM